MSATGAARVAAQAKINLALRVLAREAGGHHQLETLFQRLELADRVVVRATRGGRSLDCAGPALPPAGLGPVERNLAWRAALAYAEAAGWPRGFAIEVEKRIPVGGGLGGGSADAGAVLRALDALAPRPLGEPRLLALAAALGADVPFVTAEAPLALAWGRGERLLALPPLPARDVLLFVPPFGVPTPDAFAWLAEARAAAGHVPGRDARALTLSTLASWDGVERIAGNDLEPVVAARHPEIARHVAGLEALGARVARMSGSGSTVFGLFDAAGFARLKLTPETVAADPALTVTRTATRVEGVERIE